MSPAQRIIDFVLDRSFQEPNERRALLYRDLSTLVVDEESARRLREMADDIEALERKQQQLVLEFKRGAL